MSDEPAREREITLDEAVVCICGATDISEISADLFEHYQSLARHPLCLNRSSRRELASSELFTPYQIESVFDYRQRNGDILSLAELSVVDGFTPELCRVLANFLDFAQSNTQAGYSVDADASVMCGAKIAEGKALIQYGGSAACQVHTPLSTVLASTRARTQYAAMPGQMPDNVAWNLAYSGRGGGECRDFKSFWSQCVSTVIVGNFNARFGQGLTLYSGMQMENYSTVDAIMRRSTGLTVYNGYSEAYCMQGIAAALDFSSGRSHFMLSAFGDWRDGRYGACLQWNHRSGQVGAGVVMPAGNVWVDFQQSVKRMVLFGEVGVSAKSPWAVKDSFRALIGVRTDYQHCSAALRTSINNGTFEAAASMTAAWNSRRQHFSLGGKYELKPARDYPHKVKALASYDCQGSSDMHYLVRISSRYSEGKLQGQIRGDCTWNRQHWKLAGRMDMTVCKQLGMMACIEACYKHGIVNASVQSGIFKVDNWDDRIYVYHRDLPGIFNNSALYGRGYWISSCCAVDIWRYFRLHLYADWTAYPWAREEDKHRRPCCALKLQLAFRF